MTKVKKRSGEMEEFDRAKLEASIRTAGATEELMKKIVSRVQATEGLPTDELRKVIAAELRKEDAKVADAYQTTVRLPAKTHPEMAVGLARIPQRLPRVPAMGGPMMAWVRHGEKRMELRAEPVLPNREIWLNRADLENLGAKEGTRLAVRLAPMPTSQAGGPRPPEAQQGVGPNVPSVGVPR